MALSIVSRALSDSAKRLAVSNAQVARVMDLSSAPTRIRIGFQYGMTDAGANLTGTPRLWFGLLSNPTVDGLGELSNGVLNASTSHFVGVRTNIATWTRQGTTIPYYQMNSSESFRVTKKVGAATSMIVSDKRTGWIADVVNRRSVVILEIVKGSPNWTFQLATLRGDQSLGDNASFLIDIPYLRFSDAMSRNTMAEAVTELQAGASFTLGSAFSMAVDEGTDGTLNSVHFAWDRVSSVFEIDTIAVSLFP